MTLGRSPDPGIGNELDNRCSNSSCSRKNYIILMLEQKRVGCAFISQLWVQLWLGSQSVNRSVLCCSRYPESLVCMVGKPANTWVTLDRAVKKQHSSGESSSDKSVFSKRCQIWVSHTVQVLERDVAGSDLLYTWPKDRSLFTGFAVGM